MPKVKSDRHSFGPDSLDAHATTIVAWLAKWSAYLDNQISEEARIELDREAVEQIAKGMTSLMHMVLNRATADQQNE